MKILVTGGTDGMGKGVAKALAASGNEVIILGRSKGKLERTLLEIVEETKNENCSLVVCDLKKLEDVKHAISEIIDQHDDLDGIFINAGIGYAKSREETMDGMDAHFQVNYLSQFLLTINLLSLLEKSDNPRIIFNVTQPGEIYWDDLQMKKKWSYERGIRQAMAAKRMFLNQLNRIYQKRDQNISFVGFQINETVWTNQVNIIPKYMKLFVYVLKLFGKFISMERCGEIMAPLFTMSKEELGVYSGKLITYKKGKYVEVDEEPHILDSELQDRLWQLSLTLCNDEKTSVIAKSLD